MKYTPEQIQEARTALLGWLKPGDTVCTILRHVSRSGMQRRISVVLLAPTLSPSVANGCPDVTILHPNWSVAVVLGQRLHKGSSDSLISEGCGMDMGFDIVYRLGRALWPNGVCMGAKKGKRPAHVPHSNNGPTCQYKDAGYALKQVWL